jgi:group I intron endonuclease
MGFIYKITSPSNKCYIGQTIKTVLYRWKEHIYDANNLNQNRCKCLNTAIRKYGETKFQIETIIECDDDELNKYEEYYIQEYKSFVPYGYNIKLGGSNGKHSEETKLKISKSLIGRERTLASLEKSNEKKKNDNSLPMYICEQTKNNILIGYRICNHPNSKNIEKRFISMKLSLEEKRQLAIDYLDYLNNLKEPLEKKEPRKLPKYIRIYKNIGYYVKKPGYDNKYFTSSPSLAINLINSIEYLNSLV